MERVERRPFNREGVRSDHIHPPLAGRRSERRRVGGQVVGPVIARAPRGQRGRGVSWGGDREEDEHGKRDEDHPPGP